MNRYHKLFTALKYFLIGRNYYTALKALQFARNYHSGIRMEQYFDTIADDPIASLVKGADRIHNVQSINVFSKEKQLSYIKEVEEFFLPMIKEAKYKFPEQSSAYYNVQHMLQSQVELVKAIHKN